MLSVKKICGSSLEIEGNIEVDIELAIEVLKLFQTYNENPNIRDITPKGVGPDTHCGQAYVFAVCKCVGPGVNTPIKIFWSQVVAEQYIKDLGLADLKLLAFSVE